MNNKNKNSSNKKGKFLKVGSPLAEGSKTKRKLKKNARKRKHKITFALQCVRGSLENFS